MADLRTPLRGAEPQRGAPLCGAPGREDAALPPLRAAVEPAVLVLVFLG